MPPKKTRKPREAFGKLRRLPSGRYQASHMGPDGVRHVAPMTFDTMTDARGWLARQRTAILDGAWRDPAAVRSARRTATGTLGEYGAQWIAHRTSPSGVPLRPRTRDEYERLLRTTLAPLAAMPLQDITAATVRAWYSDLAGSGRHTLAARSYGLLRSILATAADDRVIPENPAKISGAQYASTGRVVTPPTAAELATIIEHMPPRLRAAVLIAAWAGLRYGELTELRRKDLRLVELAGDAVIVVQVSRAVVKTNAGFYIGRTKSAAGVRAVTLPPHVTGAIVRHLTDHVPDSPDALLFPASDRVSHLGQSSFTKAWYPARDAAGRPDMPWHALRHFGATRAALAGATLKELQERLGHSTTVAAMRYQHTVGRDHEIARRMSAVEDLPAG